MQLKADNKTESSDILVNFTERNENNRIDMKPLRSSNIKSANFGSVSSNPEFTFQIRKNEFLLHW